ncbi:hypothetical protein ACEZDB_32370 [Streptacidiphilus sp. N1-3]|uniref:DUF8175 domain-containing protein n=2 Tax=Streptacidiphilus alkalitolerans TaxID=3342712 RepID=A0ABV6XAQ5_9ACTN
MALVVNLTKSTPSSDTRSSPTDPTQSASQSTLPVPVAGGDPGTATQRIVSGVPVGYPHTQAGAVQAAVNYELARSSAAYFTNPSARHKILDAMATAESRAQLIKNDDTGMNHVLVAMGINSGNTNTLVARAAALGTKTDSYSDQVATVEVWMAGIIGTTGDSAPLPVSASWTTYTLTLQWENTDWKLATLSSVDGPTPLDTGTDNPSSVGDFRTANEQFKEPPYVG